MLQTIQKYEIELSERFKNWLSGLKDNQARSNIIIRLQRIEEGNFGNIRSLGDKLEEIKFKVGPGYRIYFTRKDNRIILLLQGGDKSSQKRDIKLAKQMIKDLGK